MRTSLMATERLLSATSTMQHMHVLLQTIFKHFTLVFEKRPGLSRDRLKQHSEICGEILQTLLLCGYVKAKYTDEDDEMALTVAPV